MQRKLARMSFTGAIIALVLSSGYRSVAQAPGPQTARQLRSSDRPAVFDDAQWSPEDDMQLLKTDLKSQKKQIVAANMGLTDAEAEKFWPVYDRYAADQANIYDTKLALIQEYFENYRTMSGDDAESYIRRRAAVEESIMHLRLKYAPEFRKVLTGRETALFFQIDWRLDLILNLQLAQTPMIDP
jgi:ribosome-binding ATPase YchF (GTP1/OBG family)